MMNGANSALTVLCGAFHSAARNNTKLRKREASDNNTTSLHVAVPDTSIKRVNVSCSKIGVTQASVRGCLMQVIPRMKKADTDKTLLVHMVH